MDITSVVDGLMTDHDGLMADHDGLMADHVV